MQQHMAQACPALTRTGLKDLAMSDPHWLGYSTEGYLFAAAVYFVFCFGVSRYSLRLERDLDPAQRAIADRRRRGGVTP